MFRKIISAFTSITVICWLSGLALLVPIHTADAVINEGDLIRGPDGIKVYIVNASGYKRHIFNPDVFDMYGHFTWESIQEVDQAVLDSYTTSDLYRVDVEHQVYSVGEDGIKHWLDMTADEFVSEGYSWNQVFIVNAVEGAYYTVGSEITPEAVVPEGLTLALADDTPAAASIPSGSSIEFVKFTLTADEDVNINSIKITAGGIGTYTHIDSVAIFDEGGVRLSSIKEISSDGNAIFNFSTPIVVETGVPRTLTVKATIHASGQGMLFKLGIANAADIVSNATAVGGTEVYGSEMSVLTTGAGTATIAATTSGTVNHSFGEDDVLAADFSVEATSEDLLFSGITFKNGGTRDDDLISNLKLTCDGEELATAELESNYVSFNFSNVEIENGDTAICEVKGDLGIGSADDTIELFIDDASDVDLISKISGFGTTITITDMGSDNVIAITLLAGDFTIDFDKSATPNQDVRPDTDNVVLATLKLTSNAEDATVESITGDADDLFEIQGTGLEDTYITNAEMKDVDTGSIYDLTETYVDNTEWYLELAEEISLLKGVTKTFEIRVDLEDETWSDGDTLKVVLEDGAMTITGDVSGEDIGTGEIMPTSITSATATLETSSLDVTTTTLTNTSIVGGAEDVIMYQAALEAGDSSLVTLKTVIISETVKDGSADYILFSDDYITKLDLYLDGALMDSKSGSISEAAEADSGEGYITFSSLTTNNVIPAGETVNLVLKATFASSLQSGAIKLGITSETASVISRDVNNDLIGETVTGDATADDAYSRIVTLADVGTLKVDLLTNDTRANKNMYTVAGSSGPSGRYLGELVFTTANEPVMVTELRLEKDGTATTDDIASVSLVDELGNVVITQAVESDGDVEFTNADLEFPADQATSYFIVANTKGINVLNDPTSTATSGRTIQYHIDAALGVVAEGVDSGEDVTMVVDPTTAVASRAQGTSSGATTYALDDAAEGTVFVANDDAYLYVNFSLMSTDGWVAFNVWQTGETTMYAPVINYDGTRFWDSCTINPVTKQITECGDRVSGTTKFTSVWTAADAVVEMKVPLANLGVSAGDEIEIGFAKFEYNALHAFPTSFSAHPSTYETYTLTGAAAGQWSIAEIKSQSATALGGAVTFIENAMADATLTNGSGKIIGKYTVSTYTGSNRDTDNTLMKAVLEELKITIDFNEADKISNVKAYIEGDSGNKTDAAASVGTTGNTTTIDLTTLVGGANEIAGVAESDVVLVIVADLAFTINETQKYIQTKIVDVVDTDDGLTYSDSKETSNGGNCLLTINEIIGATLSSF